MRRRHLIAGLLVFVAGCGRKGPPTLPRTDEAAEEDRNEATSDGGGDRP